MLSYQSSMNGIGLQTSLLMLDRIPALMTCMRSSASKRRSDLNYSYIRQFPASVFLMRLALISLEDQRWKTLCSLLANGYGQSDGQLNLNIHSQLNLLHEVKVMSYRKCRPTARTYLDAIKIIVYAWVHDSNKDNSSKVDYIIINPALLFRSINFYTAFDTWKFSDFSFWDLYFENLDNNDIMWFFVEDNFFLPVCSDLPSKRQ